MGGCYQRQREEKNGWTPLGANILLLPLHFLQAPGLQCYLAQAIGFLELLDSSNVFKVPSLAVGENRDGLTDPKLLGICSVGHPPESASRWYPGSLR